ncbi:MAG: hypothetical protein LBM96_08405 [Methanobrevibacter sp.]|jgi:hypothetical protein|nr:hypothetical protein [Candidatus Methanoflexus mossambicus]
MNQYLLCILITLEMAGNISTIIAMVLMIISVCYMKKTLESTNTAYSEQMKKLNEQTNLANETVGKVEQACTSIANNAKIINEAITLAKKKEIVYNLFEKLNENLSSLYIIADNNVSILFEKELPENYKEKNTYNKAIRSIKNELKYIQKIDTSPEVNSEITVILTKINLTEHSCATKSELSNLIEEIPTCSDNLYNLISNNIQQND